MQTICNIVLNNSLDDRGTDEFLSFIINLEVTGTVLPHVIFGIDQRFYET